MPSSRWSCLVALSFAVVLASGGCSSGALDDSTGSLSLELTIASGVEIDEVDWEITGGNMEPMSGSIRTSAPGSTASVEVFGLAADEGYEIAMEASGTDGMTTCQGSAMFDIEAGKVTAVMVMLNCKRPERLGGVRVNGQFNVCAELTKVVVSPLQTSVGNDIDLGSSAIDVEGDPIAYLWTGAGGSIAAPQSASTTYACEEAGEHSVTIQVSDDGFHYCVSEWTVPVTCIDGNGGVGGSGGTGGTGGSGGMGGGGTGGNEPGAAMVTVVHLAPEIPDAQDTNVDILVNGATAIEDLAYGESTGRVMLDAGEYTFGVAVAGQTEPVIELPATLSDGDDLTVVAYRTNDDPPVSVFVFSNSIDGLESGQGRVFVGHGANDSLLDPVDVILTDEGACPPPLLDQFAFGTTAPSQGTLDLAAGTVNIGFDLDPGDCTAEASVAVPVTADVVSILVAVDENTFDESLNLELWAIVDASDSPLRLNP